MDLKSSQIYITHTYPCLDFNHNINTYKSVVLVILYVEITSWLMSAYDFYSRVVNDRERTNCEVDCLLYECKDEYRDTERMILTHKKIQAKYENKISYHLTICFLAKNAIILFISC